MNGGAFSEPCTGQSDCRSTLHVHGCYADVGSCEEPGAHQPSHRSAAAHGPARAPLRPLRVRLDQVTSDRLDAIRLATGRSTAEVIALAIANLEVAK